MKKEKLMSEHDKRGFEIPDSQPMALPVGFDRPLTIQEQIRNLVRYEVSSAAGAEGYETFEEADDFEVGEEAELRSPYELDDEQADARLQDFIEESPVKQGTDVAEPEPDEEPVQKPVKAKKNTPTPKRPEKPSKDHKKAAAGDVEPDEGD